MRLALIGDIHVYRLLVPPWRLFSKRLLGQANLWLNRRFVFDRRLLPVVLQRVGAIEPDLLLGSGDLTTTSFEHEFIDIAEHLRPMALKVPTVVVPGNHDRYTFRAHRQRIMEAHLGSLMPERFPHFRALSSTWHLLALDAARPRFVSARGELGAVQLAAIRAGLAAIPPGHGLVVLCHYPMTLPAGLRDHPAHRLVDGPALSALLREFRGPVLYLHGHIHEPWCQRLGADGLSHVLDVNAGAPCLVGPAYPRGQGFWQIDLPADPAAPVRVLQHLLAAGAEAAEPAWQVRTAEGG